MIDFYPGQKSARIESSSGGETRDDVPPNRFLSRPSVGTRKKSPKKPAAESVFNEFIHGRDHSVPDGAAASIHVSPSVPLPQLPVGTRETKSSKISKGSHGGEAKVPLSPTNGVPLTPVRARKPKASDEPTSSGGSNETRTDVSPTVRLSPLPPTQSLRGTIERIRTEHRKRDDLLRTEGTLTRTIKSIVKHEVGWHPFLEAKERAAKAAEAEAIYQAIERDEFTEESRRSYVTAYAHKEARDVMTKLLKPITKELECLAVELPVTKSFLAEHKGVGLLGMAKIIGEAGDLSMYSNPAKVWKRFGLGLLSNGERQRCFKEKDKAAEAGYSPKRRSVMFVIGDSIIKAQIRKDPNDEELRIATGPLGALYLKRKQHELQRQPEDKKSPMHAHLRAKRYIEKRLLRDLWKAWNKA